MDIEELKKLAGIDEKDIERRKSYFLISGRDEELLRRLGEVLDKHADEVIDAFYEHILGFEETRKFFPDAAAIERVKVRQKEYFKRLTKGDYNLEYFEGRMHIGVVHDRLKLLPKWYLGAYSKYLQIVMPLVFKELGYSKETVEMLESFVKIIFYDMSIAITAYIFSREAKLKESEEKFRSLFEQSNDVIFIHELDGRLIDLNERTADLLGYGKEEILNIPVPKLFSADEYPKLLKAFDEINKRGFVHFESALLRKNGERVFVDVNSRIVEFGGQRVIQMIIRDITERKRAEEALREREERYRRLFTSTLDGVYRTDAKGVFVMINQAGAEMLGHKSPDEMIGRPAVDYWADPKDREIFVAELKRKKSVGNYLMRGKKKDGTEKDIEATSRILEDEKGNFLGIEGIIRDITEKRKLEKELHGRLEELETFHRVAVGRELKMVELKEQIERLEARIRELESSRAALPYR